MFSALLANIVNGTKHTKYVSLSNQKCEIQPTLINLNPNEYSRELHYYLSTVKLDKCVGSYDTPSDFSNIVCVPNKAEDLNIHVFNMITEKNELKVLIKDTWWECECKFDERKCNSNQWCNNNKCQCECKNHHICQKDDIWDPSNCICENEKYLASIMDNPVIWCD